MKTSLILTVFNEEKNILNFLNSLKIQIKKSDEILIVDACSTDNTVLVIKGFIEKNKKINLKIFSKNGNISVGRNYAIKNAKNEIILCTDADCELDKKWVKNISIPFEDKKIDVVAGFYKPKANSVFEKCLATYTSVMPDKLDKDNFIPSSRSIAFRKSAWEKIGGYPQWLDRGEDLYFAKALKEKGLNFKFAKDAFVHWPQRKNLHEAFMQFYGYAKGDGQALNIRNGALLVYLRYFLASYLIFISILERSIIGVLFVGILFIFYILWSIKKNYYYVKEKKAIFILPLLQFAADFAILSGTILGLIRRISFIKIKKVFIENKFILLVLWIYTFYLLFTINSGAPGMNNPYPFNMDEWHQFQAVRTTVAYGTPNIFGSANGTMLHFLISAIYLVPFTLIGYIDPINLPVTDLLMRGRIFDLLRINTLIFGLFSILALYLLAKKLNISKIITILFFVFSPIWISFSGLFKYDIALSFFIITSLLIFINFIKNPSAKNYFICAAIAALAFSVKFSALPLLPILIISFFCFFKNPFHNLKIFLISCAIYLITVLLFGVPDTVFGNGNIILFLRENLIGFPSSVGSFSLGMNPRIFLLFKQYPIIFGHSMFLLFLLSLVGLTYFLIKAWLKKNNSNYKDDLFILLSFALFYISLIPLNLYAGGNKSLVLLPFIVLIIGLFLKRSKDYGLTRKTVPFLVIIVLILNIFETFLWINLKRAESPQFIASEWIIKNIPKGTEIGLENVPIYQGIPDILEKEFYFKQDGYGEANIYKYSIIDSNSEKLPKVIVISNGEIDSITNKNSVKKKLIERLYREGYVKKYDLHAKKPYKMSELDFHFSWIGFAQTSLAVYIKK